MIRAHQYENRTLINSLELYQALGRGWDKSKQYHFWLKKLVLTNTSLESPRDYFLARKTIMGPKGSSAQYYLTTALAKAICIREGTVIAKKLRYFIEDNIERPSRMVV